MKKTEIILGIDPGTQLMGFALLRIHNGQPQVILMDTLKLTKEKDIYAYQNTHSDISAVNANYAKPAVYKELNTDEDVNGNTLYVGSIGLNKNKVRGIMKKVGGIF